MVADHAVTDVLPRLLRTPPPEFVAERNRLAKALRSAGDKELAATVVAVRRPGVSDWALNVAAGEHPDDVAELVEAAQEVIDAQEAAMEGRDGGDLRVRLKLLRVCTATVATLASGIAKRAGSTGSGSSAADITTRLIEIAANRGALELLEGGLLGAVDPGAADPFGAVGALASEPAARRGKGIDDAKPKRGTRSPAPKPDAGPSADERKKRRQAVAHAQKALAAAESAAEAAQRIVATQETAVAKARERVSEAEARLEALKESVTSDTAELESTRNRHDSAVADVETAQSALDDAERALGD